MATKVELQKIIEEQQKSIDTLLKKNEELIDTIKNQDIDLSNIELNADALYSDVWINTITELIITTAKKCAILNKANKLTDWMDIKPSVFQSKILSKYYSLLELKPIQSPLISKMLAIRLYILAYQDEVFQQYWRKLDKSCNG